MAQHFGHKQVVKSLFLFEVWIVLTRVADYSWYNAVMRIYPILFVLAIVALLVAIGILFKVIPWMQPASVLNPTSVMLNLLFNGNMDDSSGHGNNAVCSGTCPSYLASGGLLGSGAYSFDGTTNYLAVANNSNINLTDNFSLTAWVKTNSDPATDEWQGILVKGTNDSQRSWSLYLHYKAVEIQWLNGTWQSFSAASANIQSNQWYQIVYTKNGANQAIYLNGVPLSTSGSSATMIANNDPLYIGGNAIYPEERFNGVIDSLRIVNQVLSPAEVSTLYQEDQTQPPSGDTNCVKADVNTSGEVDNFDVLFVRGQLRCDIGAGAPNCVKADVNTSGKVDNFDVLFVRGQMGCTVPQQYSIVATAGAGGTIDPIGTVTVNSGDTKTFAISPDATHQINQVVVDGLEKGAISTFTFSDITVNHTISASFSSVPQTQLKPIARWDTVPYQRIDPAHPLNLSVVAFSKYGINRVVFKISGGGYTGLDKTATAMSLNPQTGVWEYWVPLTAAEFDTNSAITVEATVYGNDGGVRDKNTNAAVYGSGLSPVTLVVVPQSNADQYQRAYAWVDNTNGNDGVTNAVSTSVNDPGAGKYFKTINAAARAIQTYRGGNADGAMIYVKSGTYNTAGSNSGFVRGSNEWLTISAAPGLARTDVVITAASGIYNIERAHVQGLTLSNTSNGASVIKNCYPGASCDPANVKVWIDNSHILGIGRWPEGSANGGIYTGPVNPDIPEVYWTDSEVNKSNFGVYTQNTVLVRGLYIHEISNDPFQAAPLVINTRVDDVRGNYLDSLGNKQPHADLFQPGADADNFIMYNVRATGLHYDIFWSNIYADAATATGIALVNVFAEIDLDPNPAYGNRPVVFGGILGQYNHLLMWHNTYIWGAGSIPSDHLPLAIYLTKSYPGNFRQYSVINSSFRGNLFDALGINNLDNGEPWYQEPYLTNHGDEFLDNHFVNVNPTGDYYHGAAYGLRYSSGDPQINRNLQSPTIGQPLSAGSPLVNRENVPPVPADANGKARSTTGATIGAFEF